MRNEWIVFGFVSAFMYIAAAVYALWTWGSGGIELAGTAALLVAGSLAGSISGYFWMVWRRINPRPEDRPEAEIADGAGVVGSFSPGSYWPFGIGLAAAALAYGLAVVQVWLIAAGLAGVLLTTAGLLFEYYVVRHRELN